MGRPALGVLPFIRPVTRCLNGREFREVVVSEHLDVGSVISGQPPKLGETRLPLLVIVGPHGCKLRNRVFVGRKFDSQVVRVADMQEPPTTDSHGDAAMAQCVAKQWDKDRLGLDAQWQRPTFESVPFGRRLFVRDPPWPVSELRRRVTPMTGPQPSEFLLRHMHRGGREVGQSAGVIGIAVRQDDVANVSDLKSQPFDLASGRQLFVELETGRVDGGLADAFERARDVVQADARVDQRQATVVFEQQTVTPRLRIGFRMKNAAIQMMDFQQPHALRRRTSNSIVLSPS